MSSQPRVEQPGSQSRHRVIVPADLSPEEALSRPAPATDDTPTIISRIGPPSAPVPAEDPAGIRGRRLAHFELIEPIGVGGMAAVIRARDTQLDRFVALKILPPEMAGDPENVRRFHQEARSAAKLDHENIARVFYCGEDQRLHFIAFEFVEGENLRAVLERRGRLPANEAVHYMLQVAAGLAHAARRGVVHRDIKPSNIIITPNGRAKLVDMGLARSLTPREGEEDLTQSGVTLGTFDYISPEQALEPRDADVRSDIYSLGCTFYHVLTGRPPVPDGTAARKLHHHQHVKPADPRQFVPDLPVEVVAILDRMMAKNPRDRFQSPEHLVHQLLLAARQLGAAPEVPEGVLSVEAALPTPPTGRPLVWATLAAAAVVGLVLLLDQGGSSHPDAHGPVPVHADSPEHGTTGKGGTVVAKEDERTPARPTPEPLKDAIYESPAEPSVEDLIQWLQKHHDVPHVELRLAGKLDLSSVRGGEAARTLLVQARQRVVIRPRDRGSRPTIWLSYDSLAREKALVALTVNSPRSLIEGIRFVIDFRGASGTEMAALWLTGGTRHEVRRCEFLQAQPSYRDEDRRLASIVAEAGRSRPELLLRDCAFLGFGKLTRGGEADEEIHLSGADLGGKDAVVRRGAVRIDAENCVFAPHAVSFRIEGNPSGEEGQVSLKHCSVLLGSGRSAVFDMATGAAASLKVAHSLVSRVPGEGEGDAAVLLRQADDRPEAIRYQGQDNCYHDLDGYWAIGEEWQKAGWSDFRRKVSEGNGQDESRVVLYGPWQIDAARQVEALEAQQLTRAFGVNLRLPALRKLGRSATQVVGVETILGEAWTPASLPAIDEKAEAAMRRVLVVEKHGDDSSNGVYPTLDVAVRSARPGDTIVIRHNGELEIDPIQLNKKGLGDLTIRAARRFRPILSLGESSEAEPALFRVHDGRLRLEGLEFRLKPQKNFRLHTVVTLVGDGECLLKDCVTTLEKAGETALAVATLVEAGKVMKLDMPPARPRDLGPKVSLEGCFIRGEGDLFWTRVGRPFGLEVKNCLVALSGMGVHVELGTDGMAPPAGHKVLLDWTRTTTYLGGNLVRLTVGKDPRGLVPVTCKASGCLFVQAATGKSLVLLDGSDGEDRPFKEKFTWDGGKNAYGGYTSLQAQQPGGEEMPPPPMGSDRWKTLPGEEYSTFGVKLAGSPPPDTRYSQMEPGQFKAPRDATDSGASMARLPRPTR